MCEKKAHLHLSITHKNKYLLQTIASCEDENMNEIVSELIEEKAHEYDIKIPQNIIAKDI